MPSPRIRIAAVATGVAVAATAAVAVPALTTAQSPGTRTIAVQAKVVQVAIDDLAPKSRRGERVSHGDRIVTRQAMFDASRRPRGTLHTDCTAVGPTKPLFGGALLHCTLTYRFGDGQLVAAGVMSLTGSTPVAVVGGTGAYAGARGTVQLAKPAKGFDSGDVITIAG